MAIFSNDGWDVFGQEGGEKTVYISIPGTSTYVPYTDTVTGYKYVAYEGENYIRYTDVDWLTVNINSYSTTDINITLTVTPGSSYGSAKIYVTENEGSSSTEYSFDVYQYNGYTKLWASKKVSLQTVDFNFIIKDDKHNTVFEGTAYSPTGGTVFDITPVAQSIFTRPSLYIPDLQETSTVEDIDITKILVLTNRKTGKYITAAPYIYNWDYTEPQTIHIPFILNSPLTNTITSNMFPTVTSYMCPGNWRFDLIRNGEVVDHVTVRSEYNVSAVTRASTYFTTLPIEGDEIKIYNITDTSKSITYKVVCGNKGFYYLNKFGAYDIFTIDTNVKVIDSYDRTSYTRDAVYGTNTFGEVNITNRIETEYETVTNWLTDDQSEKFATEFLQSPQVYFVDGNNIRPVNITNTSVEHKLFRNGRNLNQYTITYKLSQYKIIR